MSIPNDLPGLNFDLGETAEMMRDQVRGFASAEIAPRAADIDRDTNGAGGDVDGGQRPVP